AAPPLPALLVVHEVVEADENGARDHCRGTTSAVTSFLSRKTWIGRTSCVPDPDDDDDDDCPPPRSCPSLSAPPTRISHVSRKSTHGLGEANFTAARMRMPAR